MTISNETLIKQMNIIKSGNDVTLRDDNARAFVLDQIASSSTLQKLGTYFANSAAGSIDRLGVKSRNLKLHKGSATTPDGTDIKTEVSINFALAAVYLDTWIDNGNTFYTARTRGQDVRQALLSLMQQQFAADTQDLAFNGDEASTDEFLKLRTGFVARARKAATDKPAGNEIGFAHDGLEALPTISELTGYSAEIESKWLKAGQYKWFMSQATAIHYVQELQSRNTALGDATIVDGQLTNIGGYGVEVVDNMDNNVILFTTYDNLTTVYGLNVTLTTAAQDSTAVAKQATYHFMLESVDFIIRNNSMLGLIGVAPKA